MLAKVIYCNNPLDPVHDREIVTLTRKRRIDKLAPKISSPFIAVLNGQPVLRENDGWKQSIKNNDILVFVAVPQGGGGGSNPLKLALIVALSFAAPGIGNFIAGDLAAVGAFGTGITYGALAGAAVSFLGSSLINAVMPTQTPSSYNNNSLNVASPSPTYNINAQGNAARLMQTIPVIYGRHLIYPDFAAEPYSEYSGNEQYLYQLLSVGIGEYDVEQIRIEDTDISNYEEVTYEIVKPGNSVTLFPTNVVTATEVSGQELSGTINGTYTTSGTTATITATAHGQGVGQKVSLTFNNNASYNDGYIITSTPTPDKFTVTLASTPTVTSGSVIVASYVGAYTVNLPTTSISRIAVDIVLPQGLFYANDNGGLDTRTVAWSVVARKLDDNGNGIGGYFVLGAETFSAATNTPQRLTYRYDVAPGRYEVMLARTNAKDTSARTGNAVNWAAVRGYVTGSEKYPSTMIAIRIRATNNISNTSARRFNMIVTRKLPMYVNGQWTQPTATRSIAWAVADMLRAPYGGMASDARIDLRKLVHLEKTWSARGDTFDAVVDSRMTVWEAITTALRMGRTRPFFQGGIVRFVRDQQETLPVAMFNMRNIIKGSLKTQYIMNDTDTADSVIVEYFDSTTWKPAEVTATLPGSTNVNPARVKLFGCTDRTRAWKEGMYMAASNRYRRQTITFSTEMEGFIPALGDLIAISHDRPNWGKSGEIIGLTIASNQIRYSEELDRVSPWSRTGIDNVAGNALLSPNDTITASRVVPNATTGYHYLDYLINTLTDNQTLSISIYFNQHVLPRVGLSFIGKDNGETFMEFNFGDGRVTSTALANQTNAKFAVEVLDSGWYRLEISNLSAKSGATVPRFRIYGGINAGISMAQWTKNAATSVGIAISNPIDTDGYDLWSADSLVESATNARHYVSQWLNFIAGKTVVVEQYIRPIVTANARYATIVFSSGGAFSTVQSVIIDLNNGSVTNVAGTAISAISVSDISELGNGWFKVALEMTSTATGLSSWQIGLSNVNNNPVASYLGDGVSGIYVYRPYAYWKVENNSVGLYVTPTFASLTGDNYSGFYAWGADIEYSATVGKYVRSQNTATTANILQLSEPVTFEASGTNYIALRATDGSVAGPFVAEPSEVSDEAVVYNLGGFTPYYGHEKEKTYFAFGVGELYSRTAKVVSVKPVTAETVEITAVNEDAAVHTADTSSNPPVSSYWNLPSKISKPIVDGISVNLGGTSTSPTFDIGWLPAAGADKYIVEITFDDGATWKRLGESFTNHFTTAAHYGLITIRVAAMSEFARGDWQYWSGDPFAVPPFDLTKFTVVAQPDGTRQFDWSFDASPPPDIAGYKIKYRLGSGWTWDDLYDLHTSLITSSPYENNQLSSGIYTFAIKAIDTTGHESVNATFVDADLPDPRLAGVIYQTRPNSEGWPGIKTNCFVQPEYNVLAANDTKSWTDFATWADYQRWITQAVSSMSYETDPIDVGYIVGFKPLVSATGTGIQVIEESHSDDGITYSAWAPLSGQIVCRYVKIKITVTGSLVRLTDMDIKLDGVAKSEDINDLDTSTLTGVNYIGVGDIRAPLRKTYNAISQIQVSLQNVGYGWSWEVIDKDATVGPRIKIYDNTGTPADATIDIFVRGF